MSIPENLPETFLFIFLSVGALSLFGFLAVASYSEARRQERDSYYRNDMLKKLAESQSPAAAATLGGMINLAIGIGLLVFLHAVVRNTPAFYVGLIPGLIGVALLLYHYLLAPRVER